MQIRKAEERDLSGILNVLKKSLGETSSQKTEAVWNYKHANNPFGKSLILIACIDGKIVGVRAFMRWQWKCGNAEYSAFRAVDTATDPDFQGKGIFKKLTLKALDIGKEDGDNFVFNTPNAQSKPGYLKMGWKEVAKIKLSIKPTNLLNYFSQGKTLNQKVDSNCSDEELEALLEQYNSKIEKKKVIFTPKSRNYLRWRYEENKLQKYKVYYNCDVYIAGYLKRRGKISELRLTECIYISKNGKKKAKQILKSWSREVKANFISYNLMSESLFLYSLNGNYGPALTFKEIELGAKPESFFLNLQNWEYSLGDLELF